MLEWIKNLFRKKKTETKLSDFEKLVIYIREREQENLNSAIKGATDKQAKFDECRVMLNYAKAIRRGLV